LDKIRVRDADVVHLEQGDRAAGVLAEEVEVRVARGEYLNPVAAWERQLGRGWFLELNAKAHHIAQEADHWVVFLRRDAEPAQSQDFHELSFPTLLVGGHSGRAAAGLDESILTRRNVYGVPPSSSSQPAIMALMRWTPKQRKTCPG
jgi:hypothetical protein